MGIVTKPKNPANAPRCAQCPYFARAFYGGDVPGRVGEIEALRLGCRTVPAKRVIYRAGETARELQVLHSGWALRYKLLNGGRRQILSFALPGDTVCVRMLFLDSGSFSVQALTACTICSFDRDDFAAFVTGHSDVARGAELLCVENNAAIEEQMADIGRRSAYERVGRLILNLARRMQAKGMLQGLAGHLPLSQTHIADALGLTAIHVGRVLRELQEDRVVSLRRAHFEIHDLAALERL